MCHSDHYIYIRSNSYYFYVHEMESLQLSLEAAQDPQRVRVYEKYMEYLRTTGHNESYSESLSSQPKLSSASKLKKYTEFDQFRITLVEEVSKNEAQV